MRLVSLVPDAVPSGLAVDAMPAGSVRILYDKRTGELLVDGPTDAELTSVMVRINDSLDELPPELAFVKDAATWSDDTAIVLSNDERAQSFLEYRDGTPFRLRTGDSLGPLLPSGLDEDSMTGSLTVAYTLLGSFALWNADVAYVPEPVFSLPGLAVLAIWSAGRPRTRRTSHR